jgi:superfamily I DNA and RNA helicase
LIDEGQDLPPAFYQLAHRSLREPKRLHWAYDEAQGIGSLVVPDGRTLFGSEDDLAKVRLDRRCRVFTRCYRVPQLLLMVAQAVNMGLFRKDGPLQAITRSRTWKTLGYEVQGAFHRKSEVELRRLPETNVHPLDTDPWFSGLAGAPLVLRPFPGDGEQEWVAEEVAKDIRRGFAPSDILVTSLRDWKAKEHTERLEAALSARGVRVLRTDLRENHSVFKKEGAVTLSDVFRAKGNEAWKVYVTRFDLAAGRRGPGSEAEVLKRNEAYVALTRARLWCVVTGRASPIFAEAEEAMRQFPVFKFPGFDRGCLFRTLEEEQEEGET